MATFGELRGEIAGLLKQTNNGLLNTEISQAINDAVDFHQARRFDFNDGFASFPTVADTAAYDLPADLVGITHARIAWSNNNFTKLYKRNWDWFLRATESAGDLRATPSSHYAIRQQQIHLYPTPSSAFTIELYYAAKLDPTPFTQDDQENAWTNDARLLIRTRALYDLYLNKTQQPDYASAQLQFERDALDRLMRSAAMNLGQQDLTPFEF